jgi:hypothetical protein
MCNVEHDAHCKRIRQMKTERKKKRKKKRRRRRKRRGRTRGNNGGAATSIGAVEFRHGLPMRP